MNSITCNKHGNTNKSPIKLNVAENKFDIGDLFTEAKPHQVNLRSPLPRIHYYQNKRLQVKGISVPNTNFQLNPYSNIQLDL